MKMRLSRIQNIHKYKYDNDKDFYNKLFSADGLDKFKAATSNEHAVFDEFLENKNLKKDDLIKVTNKKSAVSLNKSQRKELMSCKCFYCGMHAEMLSDTDGYYAECVHCGAVGTIADTIDVAISNWKLCMTDDDEYSGPKLYKDDAPFIESKASKINAYFDDTINSIDSILDEIQNVLDSNEDMTDSERLLEKTGDIINSAAKDNIETLKNDSSSIRETDEVILTTEQETRLQSCACGYCGMSAQVKKDDSGYWVQCSHCDAVATIAENVDMALSNWSSIMNKEHIVATNNTILDKANGMSNKNQESSDSDEINDGVTLIDEQGIQEDNAVEPSILRNVSEGADSSLNPKIKGHLVSSYRRVINISPNDCINPIELQMPDGNMVCFDCCDEFIINNQKKYLIALQKHTPDSVLFFVLRQRHDKKVMIAEGPEQKKAYRWFIEKNKDKYDFTDEIAIEKIEKKKKVFAQDTVELLFKTSDNIPDILIIPDKYERIPSNVLAKLKPNGKRIRQIVISDTIQEIEDKAFDGLIVTEAIHIPTSVKKIGSNAFTLEEGAYIYFNGLSKAYLDYPKTKHTVILDAPYKRTVARETDKILEEISHSKNITRIKHQVLPRLIEKPIVDEIIVPDGVCVISSSAFDNAKIRKRIVIPNSVTRIGSYSFDLLQGAYVECEEKSYAYLYCKENGIRNSVDISNYYKSNGVCAYCGGRFSGLFKKKCSLCGKEKDY